MYYICKLNLNLFLTIARKQETFKFIALVFFARSFSNNCIFLSIRKKLTVLSKISYICMNFAVIHFDVFGHSLFFLFSFKRDDCYTFIQKSINRVVFTEAIFPWNPYLHIFPYTTRTKIFELTPVFKQINCLWKKNF